MAKKTRTPHRIRQVEESTSRRVAVYIRRSTDEDNQPYSLEAQETKLRAFVESQPGDWQIVKIYSDDASGATTEREGLQRMLRAARAGMFDTLLVYRVDRFSRRLRDLVGLLDELTDAGVVFRSATEPFDTSTPVGRMLVQMLGVFAEFEREVIIDRVIAGMERKAAKGLWNGGSVPYGYAKNPATQNYVAVEDEAAIVRRIFDLYTKDRLGTRAIASVLNDRGLRTKRGNPWSQRSVETVINNRQYLGEKSFRGITVTDAHEAIITEAQFKYAQSILTRRSEEHGQRAANASNYTLTGKIPCPQCGSKYIGTVAHGRHNRYRYYMCWSRNRYGAKKGCDIHRLNADELEQAIGQALLDFYTTGHNIIDQAVGEFVAAHNQETGSRRDELTAVNRQLRDNSIAVDRYLTAFEKGTLDDEDPEIQNRLTNLRRQAKQLRADKARLEFDLDQPPVGPSPAELTMIRNHITEIIRDGDHKAKKALFEALIEAVEIQSDDSVIPRFRIPTATNDQGLALGPALDQLPVSDTVRVPPHPVEPRGLEPLTPTLPGPS
ncbi:recombinase family protein [Catellatospora citrea]|uniref:Recombinase RecB n=1 Tax=Catellatospora citrea TaxID=53366 RepID=A0A8J3KG85_9ACTN|nr:recombinase family protein [Catellatospora citrea]RKE07954.1 site-specific DNA recombinase [Catellatospora citrea]GIF98333.1 recombinase RecB [Catellatospora citrea]